MIIRCACGLHHIPDWLEFPQPICSKDEDDNQMAFMRLPFWPMIYPHLPCQPLIEGETEKVVEFEPPFGFNYHPFWRAIKNAYDESAADCRWQLQEMSEVAAMAPSPYNYYQRLQKLRINCACINCSCINYSK